MTISQRIFIFLLCITWPSYSVQVQIQEEMTLRVSEETDSGNYTGKAVGILPKGSIVDIPRRYVVRDPDGKVNLDFTLQKWFTQGGKTFQIYGEDLALFYTPITVVHPKFPELKGQQLYTGLQDLKLREEGSTLMTVVEDTELVSVISELDAQTQAGALCSGICERPEEILDKSAKDFIAKMNKVSERISTELQKTSYKTQKDYERYTKALGENLEETCGISQADLCQEVAKVVEEFKERRIPITLPEMMGVILKESVGDCRAVSPTNDHGPWQINMLNLEADIQRGRAKECSPQEFNNRLQQAKNSEDSVEFWKSSRPPVCVFNPMYSLRKAAALLKEHAGTYHRLLGSKPEYAEMLADPELFKRFLISGYNGGPEHPIKAVKDLTIFNTQLQKRLADEGKDITKANRGILAIKQDIQAADQHIAQFQSQIDDLNSQIESQQQALQQMSDTLTPSETQIRELKAQEEKIDETLSQIPEELAARLKTIEEQRQAEIHQAQQLAEQNIERAREMAIQWNALNRADENLIRTQQSILSSLDKSLNSLRSRRVSHLPPMSAKRTAETLAVMALEESALDRLIQEIEEEKWPYYLNQLTATANTKPSQSPSTNTNPPQSPSSDQTETAASSAADSSDSSIMFSVPSISWTENLSRRGQRELKFISSRVHRMRRTAGQLIEMFNPSIPDVYGIRSLEDELGKLQSHRNSKEFLNETGHKPLQSTNQIDQEIQEVTNRIAQAQEKRRTDIKNILNKEYRDSLSEEEMAHALKIIEDQTGEFSFGLGRPGEDNFVRNAALFFSPHSEEVLQLEHAYKDLSYRIEKQKQAKTASRRQQQNEEYHRQFRSRFKHTNEQNFDSPIPEQHYFTDLAKQEEIQLRYLSVLLNADNTNLLNRLNQWKQQRVQTDKQRRDLEEDPFFKQVSPYFTNQKGTGNITVGARVRYFFENPAQQVLTATMDLPALLSAQVHTSQASVFKTIIENQISDIEDQIQTTLAQRNRTQQLLNATRKQRVENHDRQKLLEQDRNRFEDDLAAGKKHLVWEDIKLFFFAAELKAGIENTGLRSRRDTSNATSNISYVDAILGTQNVEKNPRRVFSKQHRKNTGLANTRALQNLCKEQ